MGRTSPAGPALCLKRGPRDLTEKGGQKPTKVRNQPTDTEVLSLNKFKTFCGPNRSDDQMKRCSYLYWQHCQKSGFHTCCWPTRRPPLPAHPAAWWRCAPAPCCSCPSMTPGRQDGAGCSLSAPPPGTWGTYYHAAHYYCYYLLRLMWLFTEKK